MSKKPPSKPRETGDPRFKGATPEKLARALMRRIRPYKPGRKLPAQKEKIK